jgi:A/G-specific adenine glycosylase
VTKVVKSDATNRTPDLSDRILEWYAKHGRDLPWRHTRNPYFIWVSEVMLQQTQVDTVIPYYHRFLSQFPTIEDLASASLQDVLKCWENMGYYARARHLHLSARKIIELMGGHIPRTLDGLLGLPGVGTYTAGAILSIAFNQKVPAVDGNVRRVISRLFAFKGVLDEKTNRNNICRITGEMIPETDPGRFNQALMDFGATVCTFKKPSCRICPLQDVCLAFQKGIQDEVPSPKRRGPLPHKEIAAGIISDKKGRLLIIRRPNNGLLGGLWRFPGGESTGSENSPEETLRRIAHEELGIRIRGAEPIVSVEHAYTHFRITLHAFRCIWNGDQPHVREGLNWRWATPRMLSRFPFSKAERKVIDAL